MRASAILDHQQNTHGRLMLTVLGGLAEFERELILARTGDGRTRTKAKGVRFGGPLRGRRGRRPVGGHR
jgi:DNA invertase Pin-like site-specific DNA recombinase